LRLEINQAVRREKAGAEVAILLHKRTVFNGKHIRV
jgi:hypothetical protein